MNNAPRKLLFSTTLADCDIDTFCTGGPGGQAQNKKASGVRITHRESGAVGEAREHRSQHANKKAAWERMCKSKTFMAWAKLKAAKIHGAPSVEEVVAKQMQPHHIREEWRCQFCEKMTPASDWKDDKCPKCGSKYDALLAQEGDD